MFYKTKISLNMQGMVLFDPLVLDNFVQSKGIKRCEHFRLFYSEP